MVNKKYKISVDDVTDSLFFNSILHYASNIMSQYSRNAEGYKRLSESERRIIDTFEFLKNIHTCLRSIEMCLLFARRVYGKDFLKQHEFSMVDYYIYHYDSICHKVATLKDLNFKLINVVYDLNIKDRINWTNININKEKINNEQLFKLLEIYNNVCRYHEEERHRSTHEGNIKLSTLDDYHLYLTLADFSKKGYIPSNAESYIYNEKSHHFKFIESESKKETLMVFESIKWNTFNLEKCIMCSMLMRLDYLCPDEIRKKYPDESSFIHDCFLKNNCPHKNDVLCRMWLKTDNMGRMSDKT